MVALPNSLLLVLQEPLEAIHVHAGNKSVWMLGHSICAESTLVSVGLLLLFFFFFLLLLLLGRVSMVQEKVASWLRLISRLLPLVPELVRSSLWMTVAAAGVLVCAGG